MEKTLQFWMPLITTFLGALFGALFGAISAFWVSQKNEKIRRNRERWIKHWNALVQIQTPLNENFNILFDNTKLAEKGIKAIHKAIESNGKRLPLLWIFPHALTYDHKIVSGLLRNDLINSFFSYRQTIRKMNDDINTINQKYIEIKDAYVNKHFNDHQYMAFLKEYISEFKILIGAFNLTSDKTKNIMVEVRASLRKDETQNKSDFSILPGPIILSEEEKEEIKERVEKEIIEIKERSRKELDNYL